jgi:hypothetical protein
VSGPQTEASIDGGGSLHTDFKFSGSEEYLAPTDRNLAIAHEYAPAFPPQTDNTPYGQ